MKILLLSARFLAATLFLSASITIFGQDVKPVLRVDDREKQLPVAAGNNLQCAGYIQDSPVRTDMEIVGAYDEREQNVYSENNFVYIKRGSGGAQVGDVFSVVRPRGRVSTKFSRKGSLGIYVQEVGEVEVIRVKQDVLVGRVKTSCEEFLFGDLLQPVPNRASPTFEQRPALDLFADASGKAVGRIVMARDGREALTSEQIVYVDLGAEDNVKTGDYLTIFRPPGKGGVLNSNQKESVEARNRDYGSKVYGGNEFSIMAPRKSGENANGSIVTRRDAKSRRPSGLRQVVGEMIILNVKERTATALITRNAREIHPGDMVEIQ